MGIIDNLSNVNLMNNFLLISFFLMFAVLFFVENYNSKSPVRWVDMLLDKSTNRMSLTKFGQFWGIAISSWVVIFMSQMPEAYSIFPMIFPAWLAYLGGMTAWNSYLKNKQNKKGEEE